MRPWQPLDDKDLKKFLGLVMLMGFTKKNKVDSYWSRNTLLATPAFSELMSRRRFQRIMKYLHFNENEHMPASREDKLYKVRSVYNLIVERWRCLYNLGEFISIDEGMLKWRVIVQGV